VLAAPTGRAAKRLAELAGHDAATIHRLLQLRPGGDPSYDADHPLDAALVVVDETSMVDVILASKLVKAVPPGAHLLLVGDVDQQPSVGAREVLRDLLVTGALPAIRLTKIFRQAQQSGIVINAHKINAGQQPQLTGFGDFFWFGCEDLDLFSVLAVATRGSAIGVTVTGLMIGGTAYFWHEILGFFTGLTPKLGGEAASLEKSEQMRRVA
jgi:exodeoxyribonuclease V alpha subunit